MANQSSSQIQNSSIQSKTRTTSLHKKLAATAALAMMLAAAAGANPAHAAEAKSVKVSADSYTVSTLPGKNYGSADKIAIGLDQKDQKSGYLKFTNTGQISSGDNVSLTLNIAGGDAGIISVKAAPSAWDEGTITAASAPPSGSLLGSAPVAKGKQSVTIPLTAVSDSSGSLSVVLERSGSGVSRISSRETTAAPVLAVNGGSVSTPPTTPVAPVPPATTTPTKPTTPTTPAGCTVSAKLVPSCGTWFGSSETPLAGESFDAAQARFEKNAGRTMDITHYYKRGQSAMFPSASELARQNEPGKNRILFYNWKPSGMTWRQVADGSADTYLKSLAGYMKANASKPFFLSLNAEMEDEVNQTPGSGQTATDFRDFFRHTTSVLRANGATNAVTVMNYIGIDRWGNMPWFKDLYPGNDVVDWIAQDPYAFGKPPVWLTDFAGLVNRTDNSKLWPGFYNWAATNYPDKPQMLGEWGVDEAAAYPSYKTDFFNTATSQLAKFPKIKALVYWDAKGVDANGNALSVGKTDITTKASSLAAFKSFVSGDALTVARKSYFK